MPGAPTIVMKGSIIQSIDKRLANPRREHLDELRNMKAEDRLSDLAIDRKHGTLKSTQKKHADVDWFGEGRGWWPRLKNKEKKIRCAYICALEIATKYKPARPIRTFWLAGVPNTFQCYVHDTKDEAAGILVFWVTPPVRKTEAPRRGETLEDLWVIDGAKEIQAIRKRFPKGYRTEEPEEVVKGVGVYVFKSTGY